MQQEFKLLRKPGWLGKQHCREGYSIVRRDIEVAKDQDRVSSCRPHCQQLTSRAAGMGSDAVGPIPENAPERECSSAEPLHRSLYTTKLSFQADARRV